MAYFCDVSMHSLLLQHVELVVTLNLLLQRKRVQGILELTLGADEVERRSFLNEYFSTKS